MENKENTNQKLTVFGIILGLSIIISFALASYTFYALRSSDSISTTGSAKKEVTSDKVKWTSNITRIVKLSTVKDGYAKLDTDLKEVKGFLASNGIPAEQIDVSPVFMNEIYDNNQSEKNYNLVQNIEVQSTDVQKISDLAKNISSLIINKGVIYTTNSLEYYYSKLPEARIELLTNAIADAKARAGKLAEAGGKKIGNLKSASSGVVQVMAPNSAEVSDYGMYDTSKIQKEIMVTVKASFQIK
ncbi:MAG: SIMPL domain-containing protein [Minisyncoccia bacterium]